MRKQCNKQYNIKLISYSASWIIKRKPCQLIEGAGEGYIYVNEKFALLILLQTVGFFDTNARIKYEDIEKITQNISAVFYHLKYRNTNPQTLELLLAFQSYNGKSPPEFSGDCVANQVSFLKIFRYAVQEQILDFPDFSVWARMPRSMRMETAFDTVL